MISVITLSDGERNRRYIIQDWIGSQGKIWRKRAKSAQTASSNWHCACFTGRWPALTGTAVWNNCCTRGVNRDLYLEGQLFHTSQQSSHSSALSNMSPGAWTNLQSAIPFPDWAIAPVAVFWQSRKESGLPDSWLFSQLGCSTCPYTFFFLTRPQQSSLLHILPFKSLSSGWAGHCEAGPQEESERALWTNCR